MTPYRDPGPSDADLYDNDLHNLFDAATADLSPLPDLVPEAHRIVRRRRLTTRSLGAALSAALVIGAGTFALDSPWHSDGSPGFSSTQVGLSASTLSDYKTRAAALLQGIWPVADETIRPAKGAPQAFEIVAPDGKVYPLTLRTDWTAHTGGKTMLVGHTTTSGANGPEAEADIIFYRSHVMVSLFVFDTPATLIDGAQLTALANKLEASGLIELAQADHQVAQAPNGRPSPVPPPATPSPSSSEPWSSTPTASPSASMPSWIPSPSPSSYYEN